MQDYQPMKNSILFLINQKCLNLGKRLTLILTLTVNKMNAVVGRKVVKVICFGGNNRQVPKDLLGFVKIYEIIEIQKVRDL